VSRPAAAATLAAEAGITDGAGKRGWTGGIARTVRLPLGPLRRGAPPLPAAGPRRSIHVTEIVIADGAELATRLRAEGLDTDEIVFKYHWPRYAPPPGAGIRSIVKSDQLRAQFDRLVAMHAIVQASIPLPVAPVLSPEREFVGYVLEYVEGVTLRELISDGMLDEARRRFEVVRQTVGKLHARSVAHGDINTSNVIAADDGRTVLVDPVPFPKRATFLQDELCLAGIERKLAPPST